MLMLMFYYASVIFPLKRNFNTSFFYILRYPHGFTDEYVTKELLIAAMYCSNKQQRIENPPKGVSIRTWLSSVQEYGYVLGKIETKTAMSPRARSWSVLQAKLLALKMKAHPKDSDFGFIISDVPKGERNRNPTEHQYSIKCPYFGSSNCTKMLCVAKKWWDIRPFNSDGTSNELLVQWASNFKDLYDTNEIPLLVSKMSDNHLRNVYFHHMLKHWGNNLPYFDYDKKNRRLDRIKNNTNVRKSGVARHLTVINLNSKAIRYSGNQARPDMSDFQVRF